MNLIDYMMQECVLVNEKRVGDGAGGFATVYEDGPEFKAAITMDTSLEAEIALKQGVTSVYTVTTHKNVVLAYDNKFRRLSDGAMFRVTSIPNQSPNFGTLNMSQVKAERWDIV